jgi:hypothetical protein
MLAAYLPRKDGAHVAKINLRPSDESANLFLALSAEGADEVGGVLWLRVD